LKITKGIFAALVFSTGMVMAGCGMNENEPSAVKQEIGEKLKVYTTIYPLEDFTNKIGGEYVEVVSVFPANADAHTYEPSTKEMVKMAEADMFIFSGAGIEGFADKAAETLNKENVKIVKAAEGIKLIEADHNHDHVHDHEENESEAHSHGDEHDVDSDHHEEDEGHQHSDDDAHHEDQHAEENHGHNDDHGEEKHSAEEHSNHGSLDPHVWLDPSLAIELAYSINHALADLLPEHEKAFEENYQLLKKDLEKLDQEFKEEIETAASKHLLVAHAAYGYWENRYGIEQIAISGLSPTQEPSQKTLMNIVEESKAHNLQYVMFEKNVSPKVAEIIREEIGATPLTLYNLESITEEDRKNGEDYFSLMRGNLETLKTALN
jgi:zinc transport system substrate-binding protein